jgi:radical SAM protein with 4Fe4S-binding SPASM domain
MTNGESLSLLNPGLPQVLSVEVTSSCNLTCVMCPRTLGSVHASEPRDVISETAWERVVEVVPRLGHLNLNGLSENFLHPRFLELIEELDQSGVKVSFSTNATLLSPEIAARIAKSSAIEFINVSIDSADPEEYRNIRGGDLERVRRGLANLAAAAKGSLRITASAVVMKLSRRGLLLLPAFLHEAGVHNLVLQAVVDVKKVSADQQLPEDVEGLLAYVRQECKRLGMSLLVVPYLAKRVRAMSGDAAVEQPPSSAREGNPLNAHTKMCTAPWDHVAVDQRGRVFPCCSSPSWEHFFGADKVVMGSIGQMSFEEIWRGAAFRRLRAGLLSGELPDVCRACPIVEEGPHPFVELRAELLLGSSSCSSNFLHLLVRNVGLRPWTRDAPLLIAPSRPRDRSSALATPSWLSLHRAARMLEEKVEVGEVGSFALPLTSGAAQRETFQLLVEDVCWLPNTEFAVVAASPRSTSSSSVARWRIEPLDFS